MEHTPCRKPTLQDYLFFTIDSEFSCCLSISDIPYYVLVMFLPCMRRTENKITGIVIEHTPHTKPILQDLLKLFVFTIDLEFFLLFTVIRPSVSCSWEGQKQDYRLHTLNECMFKHCTEA